MLMASKNKKGEGIPVNQQVAHKPRHHQGTLFEVCIVDFELYLGGFHMKKPCLHWLTLRVSFLASLIRNPA